MTAMPNIFIRSIVIEFIDKLSSTRRRLTWKKRVRNLPAVFGAIGDFVFDLMFSHYGLLLIILLSFSSNRPIKSIGKDILEKEHVQVRPSMTMDIYFPKNQSNINDDIIMFVYGGHGEVVDFFMEKEYYRFVGFFK